MTNARTILSTLLLLFVFSGQAFAANLNTTSQYKNWQNDYRKLQQMEYQVRQVARPGSSSGYRQAASICDRASSIHTHYANVFESMARYTNDPTIRLQANAQANGRRIHARSLGESAATYRRYAAQAANRGR